MNKFLGLFFHKLFKINDTPQKTALGLGIGVFAGIMPGTGPLVALFLALLLHSNRAAALLGSLLTNTWLSIVTFLLSVKVGSSIMNLNWQAVHGDWKSFFRSFHWLDLFKLSILKLILPVMVGYLVVAFALSLIVYIIALAILTRIKYAKS